MTKPSCFGTFIRTGKGSKDDSGSQGHTVKKHSNQLTWERKGLRCTTTKLSRMPLKIVDSCTTRSASHACTWIHFWHVLCTNIIITMTHAINSNTIYRHYKYAHTQMIKSWRDRDWKKKEVGIKEKKRKENLKEKERKKEEENKWINK